MPVAADVSQYGSIDDEVLGGTMDRLMESQASMKGGASKNGVVK